MWPNFGKSTISLHMKQLEFLCLTWYCHEHKMLFEYFWDLPYNFIYLECIQPIIALNFKFSGCFWELNILCVKCAKMVDFPKFGHICDTKSFYYAICQSTCTLEVSYTVS